LVSESGNSIYENREEGREKREERREEGEGKRTIKGKSGRRGKRERRRKKEKKKILLQKQIMSRMSSPESAQAQSRNKFCRTRGFILNSGVRRKNVVPPLF
jgi:hypothetical protein